MTKDKELIKNFIAYCKKELSIQSLPYIKFVGEKAWVMERKSFGEYNPAENTAYVYYLNRNTADVFRSLAHELTHHRQVELNMIGGESGATGSDIENEANAFAGIIMREFGKYNPAIYELGTEPNPLREAVINEKIIKVPQKIIDDARVAYYYITKNEKKLAKKLNTTTSNAYVDKSFKDYFTVTDMKTGEDRGVSLGLYNDPEDGSGGGVEVIDNALAVVVNMANIQDLRSFTDTVKHEIIHMMDPKLTDPQVYTGLEPRDADPTINYPKYVKTPREFDAFSSVLISKIKENLDEKSDNIQQDSKAIIQLFSDLASQELRTVALNPKYRPLIKYFSDKTDSNNSLGEFVNELGMAKTWADKPTLYKQFLKRLGTELL